MFGCSFICLRSQANRFIAEPNVVVGGVLIRQKRQRFGSCDPEYGHLPFNPLFHSPLQLNPLTVGHPALLRVFGSELLPIFS